MAVGGGDLSSPWHGREGVITGGPYAGMRVTVEQDESRSGWHIYLTSPDRNHGWDMWADTIDDVEEAFRSDLIVQWFDKVDE